MITELTSRRYFLTFLSRLTSLTSLAYLPHFSCKTAGKNSGPGQLSTTAITQETIMDKKLTRRESRTAKQLLKGAPDQVFPLLCPVREYDWIDGWDCKVVYTESGIAEDNCVFVTSFPNEGPPETWIVIRYEPNRLIEFIRVNEIRTIRYRIELTDNGNGTTSAQWNQLITALNEQGEEYIDQASQEKYQILIENLQRMINHYLETGQKLPFTNPEAHWERS